MADKAGNALISVYNKDGIDKFAKGLVDLGWNVYASGGTAKMLEEAGVAVRDVSELVGGKAILGHRVVTLSRELYAGLLADKSKKEDITELKSLDIPMIDLVCVDMYPLEQEIASEGSTRESVIEKTDIGGPTMLRAAAKGRRIVLSVASQRQEVLDWLKSGMPNKAEFIEQLAARAEYEVSRYVFDSAKYLSGNEVSGTLARLHSPTKYGENPQSSPAGIYADNRVDIDPLGLDQFVHVKGWEQSFINITDIDRLLQTVTHIGAGFMRNFGEVPAIAVGVKHGNACGSGVANNLSEAVKKMIDGDTKAIFGGVIMVNGEIDEEIADVLMSYSMSAGRRLLDGVVGASVTDEALDILSREKLRVVVNPALANLTEKSIDTKRRMRPVRGGFLEQPNYDFIQDFKHPDMQIHGKFSNQQKRDAILAWAVGCTSNSNTITLVKNGQLIGNGVGQQDRAGAGQLSLLRTTTEIAKVTKKGKKLMFTIELDAEKVAGCTAYSDSFFPFPDGPEFLTSVGVKAILSTSGSVNDEKVIKTITDAGVSVAMIPDKVGRGFYAH